MEWLTACLLLCLALYADGYSKYGRTCKDIGCLNSEVCVIAEDPCNIGHTSNCGTYPTCKKKSMVEGSHSEPARPPAPNPTPRPQYPTPRPHAPPASDFDIPPNYPPPAPPRDPYGGSPYSRPSKPADPYGGNSYGGGGNPYGGSPYGGSSHYGGNSPYGSSGGQGNKGSSALDSILSSLGGLGGGGGAGSGQGGSGITSFLSNILKNFTKPGAGGGLGLDSTRPVMKNPYYDSYAGNQAQSHSASSPTGYQPTYRSSANAPRHNQATTIKPYASYGWNMG